MTWQQWSHSTKRKWSSVKQRERKLSCVQESVDPKFSLVEPKNRKFSLIEPKNWKALLEPKISNGSGTGSDHQEPRIYELSVSGRQLSSAKLKPINKYYCSVSALDKRGCQRSLGQTEKVHSSDPHFVYKFHVVHNFEDDTTILFQLFKSKLRTLYDRKRKETVTEDVVRIAAFECGLNKIVHNAQIEFKLDMPKTCVREPRLVVTVDEHSADETLVTLELSLPELIKRGKLKYADVGVYLELYKKLHTPHPFVLFWRTGTIQTNGEHPYCWPTVEIPANRVLGTAKDRMVRVRLMNGATDEAFGEALVSFSRLVNGADFGEDGFRLQLTCANFSDEESGLAEKAGVLAIKAVKATFLDLQTMDDASEDESGDMEQPVDDDVFHEQPQEGRTQQYLVSLLLPVEKVRIHRHSSVVTPRHFAFFPSLLSFVVPSIRVRTYSL